MISKFYADTQDNTDGADKSPPPEDRKDPKKVESTNVQKNVQEAMPQNIINL